MNLSQTMPNRCGVLSGFWLKRIAIISMVIDHLNSIVLRRGILAPFLSAEGGINFSPEQPWLVYHYPQIDAVCDVLGSIAMPIFCFLITEGVLHTHNRLGYGLRLAEFALISEIPYNIAHYGTFFNPNLQNVIFTLCIGFFTIWGLDEIAGRWAGRRALCVGLSALDVLAGAGLAFLVRGEYVFLGIGAIVLFYLLRNAGIVRLAGALPLLPASVAVLLADLPIFLYSGKRGTGSKYFFYFFYPLHFLALAGVAWLCARG